MNQKFAIAVHGGAGAILSPSMNTEKEKMYKEALQQASQVGFAVLEKKGDALDAVEAAIKSLEDCPLFNAGKGSVYSFKGQHEMDASIMCGKDLKAGAIGQVSNIKNPISLARAVMEKSEYVFLCGAGAEDFARTIDIQFEGDEYFYDEARFKQWQQIQAEGGTALDHNVRIAGEKKLGTVGAVALDIHGNLAAGTSTGGMTNKKFGRIGDSPVIGAGTYANNNTCAVSCTGHGELFIRAVAAYDISALMEYKNLSLQKACNGVVMQKLRRIGGEGGAIAIDKHGNVEMVFNSQGMYRAMKNSAGKELVAIGT